MSTDSTPLPVDPVLADAILSALAQVPEGRMSLPRLCKQLGLRMSVLMRTLAWLGAGTIGGRPGPGRVSLSRVGGRDIATITEAGRRHLDRAPADPLHPAS